ncbi:CBS domain-containing protein [Phenylobacterium sp.]|jgi:CBS domain-containing protein|uniref:CBS domain-containing protein n=1 Tax=Phenylobacterium sp. TaxID=1871053 RepID=UPI002E3004BE|nr:CBS domain-containing protein [Phenylobacterium sp.]HEX3363660.1 CBS domain-containing protein [Phenylobacterium sp.]
MRVLDLIKIKGDVVITVVESIRTHDAARVMHEHNVGALVVTTAGGQLKGVLSEREIVVVVAEHGRDALQHPIAGLMLANRPTVGPTTSVRDAMAIMTEQRVRHLPVVNDGRVIGLISLGDTVKARLSEKIAENEVLQDIARWPTPTVA